MPLRLKKNTSLEAEGFQISGPSLWIPVLAAFSGAAGLAYEVFLIRLFSNYFGNSFLIAGVTLAAVFFGLAFGAWQSRRLMAHLGWIEIAIGLYAILVATCFSTWGFEIANHGGWAWLSALKLSGLLGLPAFLIGACVPLFAAYAPSRPEQFTRIYGLYNFGAFLSVLAIEFVLFRSLGLQYAIYSIALINLMVGAVLIVKFKLADKSWDQSAYAVLNGKVVTALLMLSLVSGVYQLFILRISFSVFGPLHENFAIILASAILGVTLGAWIAKRGWLGIQDAAFFVAILFLVQIIFVANLVDIWAGFAAQSANGVWFLVTKTGLLMGFALPVFILFGMLVPLAVQAHNVENLSVTSRLLAFSSLGNGFGALLMFSVLHRSFELTTIGFGLACLSLLAAWVVREDRLKASSLIFGCVGFFALALGGLAAWPQKELLLGYRILADADRLENRRDQFWDAVTYKAYDQSASLINFRDGGRSLVFNGYHSLSFGPGGKSELHEVIVGATPVLFAKNTDNALVLGLGTGITAGATARLFDQVSVVEINPAMFEIAAHFEEENQGLMTRRTAEIILEDGISTLLNAETRYDAIINTVTSPKYYAASKLYTLDFLALAKTRLTEGGVYSTWFDLNIDQAGIAMMLNTLEASFETCRYFVLTGSYFNALCADHGVTYQSTATVNARIAGAALDTLFDQYGFDRGFTRTMGGLEVSFDPSLFARQTKAVNTLDWPGIEFTLAHASDQEATQDVLAETLAANINQQRGFSGSTGDWRVNCQMISQMSFLSFSGCE